MSQQSLAKLLSAAMNHPDMPADLYNTIGDWLNDAFHEGLDISEPWVIVRALRNATQGDDERDTSDEQADTQWPKVIPG